MIKISRWWVIFVCFLTSCMLPPKTNNSGKWYDNMPRKSWLKFKLVETNQKWFEVYQLTKNTYAIYEPNQWQEAISYLLIGSEKALLVDTLQGIGSIRKVTEQLTNLPIIVINTHSHFDHVSGNYQFDTIYGVNNSYAQTNAKGHQAGTNSHYMSADTFWKNIPKDFSIDKYENKKYEIDRYIENGDIIDIGGRPIEVAFIPGHSPDSIILIDKNNRMMMTGDSFYPASIYIYEDTSSFRDFLDSTLIMVNFQSDVDFLLPGHNETMVSATYLTELREATLSILESKTPSTIEEKGVRRYQFKDFSLLVRDPLDYDISANKLINKDKK